MMAEIDGVAAFFKGTVAKAFDIIQKEHLSEGTLVRPQVESNSAKLLIYYDPSREYKGFVYRLRVRGLSVVKESFYTNDMYDVPASGTFLVSEDYRTTAVEKIVGDFVTAYSKDWPTKPLKG